VAPDRLLLAKACLGYPEVSGPTVRVSARMARPLSEATVFRGTF